MTLLRNDSPWLMTATGTRFPLRDPKPSDTEPVHRAAMLGKRCRFGGATIGVWSVAEHAVLVSRIVEELAGSADEPLGLPIPTVALYGLLHDDHEAYLGDMPTPVKWALADEDPAAIAAWRRLVDRIDAAIHTSHGLVWPAPSKVAALVHHADLVALATEKRDLMPSAAPGHPDWDIDLPEPWPARCAPAHNHCNAKGLYLKRLFELEQWRRLAAA